MALPTEIDWHLIDTSKLDPDFFAKAQGVLNACLAHGRLYRPYLGYRSTAEQAVLYQRYLAGGPRASPPGHSLHEKGLAVDCEAIVDGQGSWNVEDYSMLEAQAQVYGMDTGWAYHDYDHLSINGK
jgi:hypothetical protein